jgi:hypothetical protein
MPNKPMTLQKAMQAQAPLVMEANEAPPAKPVAKKDYGEAMNLRLPRPAAKRFRQMALDHDKKLNEMFVVLVDFYAAHHPEQKAVE